MKTMLDRRAFVATGATVTLLAPFASIAQSAPSPDSRFVLVILRGGLDGLAAVPPYAERNYRALRGDLALPPPGQVDGILDLDGHFGLHPALERMHGMYEAGELAVLHAVATPYRDRSHFDGQKVLEAGGATPAASSGGWLNRAVTALAAAGKRRDAIALAPNVPLVLRGDESVATWAPSRLPDSSEDTIARVRELYEATDARLAEQLIEALNARAIAGAIDDADERDGRNGMAPNRDAVGRELARDGMEPGSEGMEPGRGRRRALSPLATAAGRFLRAPDGPRIAVIEVDGWDTHANQGATQGRLAARLGALDAGLGTLQSELGEAWATTSVLIVTEFGRTVATNGTAGTDHGTAGCALLAGGAVKGGRVITDWPGLGSGDLFENRDLRPTLDLRSVFKAVLHEQFALPAVALEQVVFPDSETIRPLEGLVTA